MLPMVYKHPKMDMMSVLVSIDFSKRNNESIFELIPFLSDKFAKIKTSDTDDAYLRWMMKELRKIAIGNIHLHELADIIRKGGIPEVEEFIKKFHK